MALVAYIYNDPTKVWKAVWPSVPQGHRNACVYLLNYSTLLQRS